MVRKRVREGFYLYHERQSDPSWVIGKCHNPSQNGDLKEGGRNFRVGTWRDEVEVEVSWSGWDTL
jgi:hypothetical protein